MGNSEQCRGPWSSKCLNMYMIDNSLAILTSYSAIALTCNYYSLLCHSSSITGERKHGIVCNTQAIPRQDRSEAFLLMHLYLTLPCTLLIWINLKWE